MERSRITALGLALMLLGLLLTGRGLYYQTKYSGTTVQLQDISEENLRSGTAVIGQTDRSAGPYRRLRRWHTRPASYNYYYLVSAGENRYISVKITSYENARLDYQARRLEDEPPEAVDPVKIAGIVRKLPSASKNRLITYILTKNLCNPDGSRIEEAQILPWYIDYESKGSAAVSIRFGLGFLLFGTAVTVIALPSRRKNRF